MVTFNWKIIGLHHISYNHYVKASIIRSGLIFYMYIYIYLDPAFYFHPQRHFDFTFVEDRTWDELILCNMAECLSY